MIMDHTAEEPFWTAHSRTAGWTCEPTTNTAQIRAFHRSLTGYAPTPLVDLPVLAAELGVARVLAKDESHRLGLPAFKALGASWAVHRAVADHAGNPALTVVAATDGNHGRAVARFARLLGHPAVIFIPTAVHPNAIRAIEDEGATVRVIDRSYDDTVAAAASAAQADDTVLVQDTAWPGYETIPQWIVDGYATLFGEIDDQLGDADLGAPDLVAVPTGVGSLLQAALIHYRSRAAGATRVVSVEPTAAGCVAASLRAADLVSVDTRPTPMAGLNCGTPSTLAWPLILNGLDAAITVTDAADLHAAHDLAAAGVAAGPCGAAPLAGLRAALTGPGSDARRRHLRVDADSTVVLLITEGVQSNPLPPDPALKAVPDRELPARQG